MVCILLTPSQRSAHLTWCGQQQHWNQVQRAFIPLREEWRFSLKHRLSPCSHLEGDRDPKSSFPFQLIVRSAYHLRLFKEVPNWLGADNSSTGIKFNGPSFFLEKLTVDVFSSGKRQALEIFLPPSSYLIGLPTTEAFAKKRPSDLVRQRQHWNQVHGLCSSQRRIQIPPWILTVIVFLSGKRQGPEIFLSTSG